MSSSVWRGALLLTAAAVGVKIMSAAYRIPFQNLAGDLGFYVYQQIYPFFAAALFLAAYGFPAALSKVVSEHISEHPNEGAGTLFARSFFILSLFSVVVFAFLYYGTSWISAAMGDSRLIAPLRAVSFSFLFIPLIAAVRGFLQGHGKMGPTAVSQLFEQSVRAGLIIGFAWLAFVKGFGSYFTGKLAAIGSVAGLAASCLILIAYMIRHRSFLMQGASISFSRLGKVLLYDGLIYSFSSMMLIFCLLIDTVTVVPLLQTDPLNAMRLMGIYDRGYPLVQLCTAAALSFSLAFVPALAKANKHGDLAFVREKSGQAVKVCTAFGSAAALGFAILAP
ncbi:MAG TPA: oligosaccharide flippase family protein, partial [Bacillales bacterium]|nr:oligosaccharide flippase family protein [Bacillales bacterium]